MDYNTKYSSQAPQWKREQKERKTGESKEEAAVDRGTMSLYARPVARVLLKAFRW